MALGYARLVYSTAGIENLLERVIKAAESPAQPSPATFLSLSRFPSRRLKDEVIVALSSSFY